MSLTEKALVEAIQNIEAMCLLSAQAISIRPTKMVMYPYPDDTAESFENRCIAAKNVCESLYQTKGD